MEPSTGERKCCQSNSHVTGSHTHIVREDGDERKLFHDDEGLDVFGNVLSFIHYLTVIKLWGRGGK